MTDDIWTPSDSFLLSDPIAKAKVDNPHAADTALVLSDVTDDEANAEAAACVLAEAAGDDPEGLVLEDDTDDDLEHVGMPGDVVAGI